MHCQEQEFYNTIRELTNMKYKRIVKKNNNQGGKMYRNLFPPINEAMKSVTPPILANANDDGLRREV